MQHQNLQNDGFVKVVLFFLTLIAHSYFYHGSFWNQNSRLDGIYVFVEPGYPETGTFKIDRFVPDPVKGVNTGDWAKYADHYYSNKAPGSTIIGIPIYFLLYHGEKLFGVDPASPEYYNVAVYNAYVLSVFGGALWTAIACVCLFAIRKRIFDSTIDAVFVAGIYSFGTLVWPLDTMYWGHPLVAALLILSQFFIFGRKKSQYILAGIFAGAAVFTDYIVVISLILTFSFLVLSSKHRRHFFWFALGTLPFVSALLLFQKINFGSFITTAVSLSNPIFGGAKFNAFSWSVFAKLLFSAKHGIFLHMPVLILAAVGLFQKKNRNERAAFWSLQALSYIVAISCYSIWHGGLVVGARYLVPSIPFLCLLIPCWDYFSLNHKLRAAVLALWSIFNMFAIAAATPMIFNSPKNPLFFRVYRLFLMGSYLSPVDTVHTFFYPTLEQKRRGVFNYGERFLGLHGIWSAAPLTLILFICIVVFLDKAIPWKKTALELKAAPGSAFAFLIFLAGIGGTVYLLQQKGP